MHSVLIVDDEKQVVKDLSGLIEMFCPQLKLEGTATSSDRAIEMIKEIKPDIVFLDIQIDEKSGMDVLNEVPEVDFQLIFVTAHQEYAVDAFKFSAVDYLLKPVDPEELVQAVDKALNQKNQNAIKSQLSALVENLGREFKPKKIVLTDMEGVHIIDVSDILWCHANGSYTKFHLSDGSQMMVSKHLKTYEMMLEKYGFYRVHRSYLINGDAIVKVDRSQGLVQMKNNHHLPVSIPPETLRHILDVIQK